MSPAEIVFAVLGVVVAIVVAAPRLLEWRRGYVVCSLEVTSIRGRPVAKLALESKSVYRRKIDWACLIVSSPDADFVECISNQMTERLESTNDIIRLKDLECKQFNRDDLRVIPLPFFCSEQLGIRDEKVTCSVPLDQDLSPGWYDLRFFVFPPPETQRRRFGYHRCVHAVCFVDRE